MGYNTVAFLLNDFMHETIKSPHAVADGVCYPPHSLREDEQRAWRRHVDLTADEYKEPRLHLQALEVLPTFHADLHQWLVAGGNSITTLKLLKFGKTKEGKKTVTLELPDWWGR